MTDKVFEGNSIVSPEEIDEILPQTQCGLCGYGGCMPYAEAIVFDQAPLNLCPPGGINTLQALGQLLNQDITPWLPEMEKKTKPKTLAVIRETACIGCTKCIQACPVDAIVGSAKHMHTVITDACTGCDLCAPVCPVDCIDMVANTQELSPTAQKNKAQQARERFYSHQQRLANEKRTDEASLQRSLRDRKEYVQAAMARVRAKKLF